MLSDTTGFGYFGSQETIRLGGDQLESRTKQPKTGATQYHAQLGHPDKGPTNIGLVFNPPPPYKKKTS